MARLRREPVLRRGGWGCCSRTARWALDEVGGQETPGVSGQTPGWSGDCCVLQPSSCPLSLVVAFLELCSPCRCVCPVLPPLLHAGQRCLQPAGGHPWGESSQTQGSAPFWGRGSEECCCLLGEAGSLSLV